METKGLFKSRRRAAAWLLGLLGLIALTPSALANPIGTTGDREQFKMIKNKTDITSSDGQQYEFDLLIFNYDGKNYFWTGDVWLTLDGQNVVNLSQLCRDNHCVYTIGSGNEDNARKWAESEGDFVGSATGNLNGLTDVIVALYNPYYEQVNGEASKAIWVKMRVGIERKWYHHNYQIGIRGTWRTINEKEVSRHLTHTLYSAETGKWPTADISDGNFSRTESGKVQFETTFSNATMVNNGAMIGWDGRVQLLKEQPSSDSPYISKDKRSAHWNGEDWTVENGGKLTKTFAVTSNFDPITVYPRLERFTPSNYVNNNMTYQPKYDRDYKKVVIGGYPKASISSVSTNAWKKTVTLKWTEVKPSTVMSNAGQGQWYIYRQLGNEITKVGNVSYSTKTFTDNGLSLKEKYNYIVSYVPTGSGWTQSASTRPVADLCDTWTNVEIKPLETFVAMGSVAANDNPNNPMITVNWSLSEAIGSDETLKFTLYHSTDEGRNKTWTVLQDNIDAKASLGTEYSYKHQLNNEPNTCAPHFYKVAITAMGEDYSDETTAGVSSNASGGIVKGSLTASKGMFTNVVKLRWQALQVGSSDITYIIYRRQLGTDQSFSQLAKISGKDNSYSYDDIAAAPGDYYEYQVESVCECTVTKDGKTYNNDSHLFDSDDGFCATSGVVSGTVNYGKGTAVKDVKVSLVRVSDGDAQNNSQYHSASFDYIAGTNIINRSSILVPLTADQDNDLFVSTPWTIQLYVRVDALTDQGAYLVYSKDNLSLQAKTSGSGYRLHFGYANGNSTIATKEVTEKTLEYGRFYNVAYSYDNDTKTYSVSIMDVENGEETMTTSSQKASYASHWVSGSKGLVFGDAYNEEAPTPTSTTTVNYGWKGNLDDIRVFSGRKLSNDEIRKNYNHVLAGNEKGLVVYLPLDEGIANQRTAYDMSKTSGVSNGHHGKFVGMARSSSVVPDDDQLALFNYTDENGNYTVSGVPFSGEGISYMVTPMLGVHEFAPNYATRFVSGNSLIHSGVDFKDTSSFPVSGKVVYEHTSIPVEDVYLYVDGQVASQNGKIVKTDAEGNYSIDVPIGEHYISVELNGHEFKNAGRYPSDPSKLAVFDRERPNVMFYDVTTVVVAGRVAGGDVENAKPLGLGNGIANIGQATLQLVPTAAGKLNVDPVINETTFRWEDRDTVLNYATNPPVSDKVNSEAYIATGQQFITIKTDPESGEFVAKLPPLNYKVTSVKLDHYPQSMPTALAHIPVPVFENLPLIDATKPLAVHTDSLLTADNTYVYFDYVGSAKIEYKTHSNLDVVENEDGTFGMNSIKVNPTDEEEFALIDSNKNYVFGFPIYRQFDEYAYKLYAYERYYNLDDVEFDKNNNDSFTGVPAISDVPLSNADVTIKCDYSTTTGVWFDGDGKVDPKHPVEVQANTFQLDSLGRGVFHFIADVPNIDEKSHFARFLSIQYNDGQNQTWNHPLTVNGEELPFQAVVLGSLPTGNNFVTEGPDQVMMILRDPPGSNSSATFSKGHQYIYQRSAVVTPHEEFEATTVSHLGVKEKLLNAIDPIPAAFVINDVQSRFDLTVGAQVNASFSNNQYWTYTTTTTTDVSTSSDPDFVGADGDLFIGASKNIVFGTCHVVRIKDVDNQKKLVAEDAVSISDVFATDFHYSQKHIVEELIPDLKKARNRLLKHVSQAEFDATTTTPTNEPIYLTTLSEDDPRFGSNNSDTVVWKSEAVPFPKTTKRVYVGPSYKAIYPDNYQGQDGVSYFNMQIKNWENILAQNEKSKVEAWENHDKWFDRNYSLDAGATVTLTMVKDTVNIRTNTETQEINLITNLVTGMGTNFFGMDINVNNTLGTTVEEEQTEGASNTKSVSYTLSESGTDYFTVDVFNAPDNHGPIFRTLAGATSCPYEDEVVTKYYMPGTVLMEKTVQVEIPEISCQNQIINGIPAGGEAVFKVDIRNLSDTGEDAYFNLFVDDKSNSEGAAIYMDGYNITNGRRILVPANETLTKTFTMKQTNPDVLEYKDLRIVLTSECQDDIADTTTVTVNFVAACSDIVLKASTSVVNSNTTAPLILSMSGYNTNMTSLTGALLQYKGANDANWTTLQEYTTNPDKVKDGKLLLKTLSGSQTLDYAIDLTAQHFTDQVYEFRALTNCVQGGEEVHSESDWIEVVRDIARPQLLVTPTPSSGVLGIGDDISILFNEDIKSSSLRTLDNFFVRGIKNESEVTHDVALSLSGNSTVKTDATINLSGKSFATNMWLNYSNDGTLLQHGVSGNNFTVAIENDKLAVTVGTQKFTSTKTLPKDKWIFLALSYDNSGATPKLNAGYAQDASTVDLMRNVEVPVYNGNGPVALGGNDLTAKVQEMALWNNANSLTEALASRFTTKSQFTNGLIGYWQFNEGHGSVAADRARQRSMTLPSDNGWFLDGVNYVMTLDGSSVAAADISTINTLASDDYLVEAWFRADAEQNGVASVMSIGNDKLDLRLNTSGQLELSTVTGADNTANTAMVSNSDLRDGQWHHVALNVLKGTNGNSTIYLDGKPRTQVKASLTPALQGDKLFLGGHRVTGDNTVTYGQFMKGAIDEVRIWKGRRTADVIASTMYHRVQGDEPGLAAYYPLEYSTLDEALQVITMGYANNLATAETSTAVGPMVVFKNDNANMGQEVTPAYSTASTPALTVAPKQENIMFNFVANERQITVNLLEEPYKIEGSTVYITVKDVNDLSGNAAADITWSVYVQQNRLKWADEEVSVVKNGNNETTFNVGIENVSSINEAYEITDLPLWLSVNNVAGSISPLSKRILTFTVDPSLAIGSYDATIHLKGAQSIPTPLNISLTVQGDRPNWVATPGQNTMTVIGQLKFVNELSTDPNDMVLSTDPNDMVAAFHGAECVGVAQPEYYAEDDTYFVLLNVFGDGAADIVYKAYDASTGQVYPSIVISNVETSIQPDRFEANKVIGSFTAPAILLPGNEIEQDLSADKAGWKWFSLYAQPKSDDISEVFRDAGQAVSNILGSGAYQSSSQDENGEWSLFAGFRFDRMYKLKVEAPYTEKIVGLPADPATSITLAKGWSWIGYPLQASKSLSAAFVNAEPKDGDIVKGQSSFAMYYDGDWTGTLQALTPGEGYMYQSNDTKEKTFTYQEPANGSRMADAPRRASRSVAEHTVATCKDNMTMIAVVMNGAELIENAQVSVYDGTELCALSTEAITQGMHFLTIGGTAGQADALTFIVATDEGSFVLPTAMTFQADAHRGTLAQPYVLQLADATGIDQAQGGAAIKSIQLFDGSGRMVRSTERPDRLYTKKDLKSLPAGVYYQQVTLSNGNNFVQKIMR